MLEEGTEWANGSETPPATTTQTAKRFSTTSAKPCFACAVRNGWLSPFGIGTLHVNCACVEVPEVITMTWKERTKVGFDTDFVQVEAGTVPPQSTRTFPEPDGGSTAVTTGPSQTRTMAYNWRLETTSYLDLYEHPELDHQGSNSEGFVTKVVTVYVGLVDA